MDKAVSIERRLAAMKKETSPIGENWSKAFDSLTICPTASMTCLTVKVNPVSLPWLIIFITRKSGKVISSHKMM